jgi:hypothetical protein
MLKYTNRARRAITGPSLAQVRRRLSAAERAVLAAEIVDGRLVLRGLTIKAIAALVGTCPAYVHRALRLTPEQRAEVCRGERPLVLPRRHTSTPAFDWNAVSDDMLVEAIRRIGLDRTLSAAVAAETAALV